MQHHPYAAPETILASLHRLAELDLGAAGDGATVWRAGLERTPAEVAALRRLLSPDELARADRYVFDRDRRRFVVARAILRLLLGRLLDRDPEGLVFEYGRFGRPELSGGGPSFNVSHSHECALFAVASGGRVGIDVEHIRSETPVEELAPRFFSPAEVADFHALPERERLAAFFACWTRKEAIVKAIGDGLGYPLDRFDVTLAPGEPARLVRVDGAPAEPGRWLLEALAPGPGYVGAIAVERA